MWQDSEGLDVLIMLSLLLTLYPVATSLRAQLNISTSYTQLGREPILRDDIVTIPFAPSACGLPVVLTPGGRGLSPQEGR